MVRTVLHSTIGHRRAVITAVALLVIAALGTPVAAAVVPQPQLVINEIMQNPDASYDSLGEWFEIHNSGDADVDLEGWTVRDDGRDDHLVEGPLVVPAGGYAVLARNGDASQNGGVVADYVFGDDLFLFNSSDQLELVDPGGTVIDRVAWDNGVTFPDPIGASMSLTSPVADNADGAAWCTATTVYGAGDLGTPGSANTCDAAPAAIVINEVLQNPDAVADVVGEWIELYNAGGSPVSLAGWTLRDNDSDLHEIPLDADVVVPAGGYVVLTRNADPTVNGGISSDYAYRGFILHNTQDEIVLADADGRLVDRIAYDDGLTFPDPRGASMSLRSPELDNAKGASWCESPVTSGPGDLSTPGLPNECTVPEPPPALIITEIMQNPGATTDARGEWFEVHNPTDAIVDLAGWTIADDDTNRHVIVGSVEIDPGGYAVFARNGDTDRNGDVTADYVYGDDIVLYNGRDEVVLLSPHDVEVDRVAYDDGLTFPDPEGDLGTVGASMALGDLAADNAAGGNWCESATPFGDGDLGTPGAANDCGIAPDDHVVVITEVHQNPYVASDTYGEWFELTNPTDVAIDLNGWVIRDDESDYHKIDAASGLVVPPGDSVVIGRDLDGARNGGVAVDYSMAGSVHLYNTTDEIEIVDLNGRVVDRVAWSHESDGWYVRNGAAMALRDIAADNDDAANWCVAGAQYGGGDLGTPGAPNTCGPVVHEPAIVINEIMQNPRAVPDSAGEWFELHNPGAFDVDIAGWTVRDNDFASHVIDGTLVIPAGGFVVLARNATPSQNGGVEVAYGFGADVTFFNGIDELELLDAQLRPVDWVRWDDGATFPDPAGASMSLRDPALDNAAGSSWCTAVTSFGDGDLGTPGEPNLCEIPPVGNPIDLRLDFYDYRDPVEVGDDIWYKAKVYNDSDEYDTVGPIAVEFQLPADVEFVEDKSNDRWTCDVSAFPMVRCEHDPARSIAAGERSKRIWLKVTPTGSADAVVVASAELDLSDAGFHDPNPDNNAAIEETTIVHPDPSGPYAPLPPGVNPGLSAILECVVDNGDGTLTARFGYENREDFDFTIPVGPDNKLHGPVIETDGPWTDFGHPNVVPGRPGRTPFGEGVFTVTFPDDGVIVWTLHGRTATASSNSKACTS